MELEAQVKQHENKLKQHDKELSRLNDVALEMQRTMNEGLARVDESNKFLREQNGRQSEQNQEILSAILERNTRSEELEFERRKYEEGLAHETDMLNKSNFWKLILGIGGSSAIIFAFIMELLKFFRG